MVGSKKLNMKAFLSIVSIVENMVMLALGVRRMEMVRNLKMRMGKKHEQWSEATSTNSGIDWAPEIQPLVVGS